jgi:hypothetical protein
VTFHVLPGATWSDAGTDVLTRAEDLLASAPCVFVEESQPTPRPCPARGPADSMLAPVAAKPTWHDTVLATKLSTAEFAPRMGPGENDIRPLRDLFHYSHIDKMETALRVLDRPEVESMQAV